MGCMCSKGAKGDESSSRNVKIKEKAKSSKRVVSSSGTDCTVELDAKLSDVTSRLITNELVDDTVETVSVVSDNGTKKKHGKSNPQKMSSIVSLANGERGAQVVAGWPSWLTAVAGEAINGWIPRRADSFEKLDKIGQGTYSSVYKARDLETDKIVALKKVRFANMDPESVRFMAREIIILRRLDHPNVMKLDGIITSRMSGSLYLVFEYMDHDLAGLLGTPGIKFSEAQIKCYMKQLLLGLEHCHSHGILHRDIKGSNLLIDSNNKLKIGDFGLATFFSSLPKQPLTSRVITLWYRPPELLLGSTDYGIAVDLWSTGCILAELFTGKPIMPGRTEVEQLHKIFKLCGSPSEEYWKRSRLPHATIFKPQHPYQRCVAHTFRDFPLAALSLLEVLIAIEPEARGTASSALDSEFFATRPLPCEPSSLPRYPPSKELDAKLRNEEARRRRATGGKVHGHETSTRSSKESRVVAALDAHPEFKKSLQKIEAQANPKSISQKYNPEEEDGGSGFRIEPQNVGSRNVFSHSGQSMHPTHFGSSRNMYANGDANLRQPGPVLVSPRKSTDMRNQRSCTHRGAKNLSRFSNSVAIRGSSHIDGNEMSVANPLWQDVHLSSRFNHVDDSSHHLLGPTKLSHNDDQSSHLESTTCLFGKKGRVLYSGPLIPPKGNIEEMLKEHERQIQQAVRKASVDKTKLSKTMQAEALLYHGNTNTARVTRI